MTTETLSMMTVEDALKEGLVIKKEDIHKMVDKELQKSEAKLKKQITKEIQMESQKKAKEADDLSIVNKMRGTGLTSIDFCRRLIHMNMPKELWKYLRDEHDNIKDNRELWRMVRESANQPKH